MKERALIWAKRAHSKLGVVGTAIEIHQKTTRAARNTPKANPKTKRPTIDTQQEEEVDQGEVRECISL